MWCVRYRELRTSSSTSTSTSSSFCACWCAFDCCGCRSDSSVRISITILHRNINKVRLSLLSIIIFIYFIVYFILFYFITSNPHTLNYLISSLIHSFIYFYFLHIFKKIYCIIFDVIQSFSTIWILICAWNSLLVNEINCLEFALYSEIYLYSIYPYLLFFNWF